MACHSDRIRRNYDLGPASIPPVNGSNAPMPTLPVKNFMNDIRTVLDEIGKGYARAEIVEVVSRIRRVVGFE